jgi:hypothetical protein
LLWQDARNYTIFMIDDLRDKLFKTRLQHGPGGLAIALRLAFPTPHLYFFSNFQSSDLPRIPQHGLAPSHRSRYCKQRDYPYKTLYIAATLLISLQLRWIGPTASISQESTNVSNGLGCGFHQK